MPVCFRRRMYPLCLSLLLVTGVPASAQPSLYDQLGGKPGVARIVARTVSLVTVDPRTKDDFDNINLDRLRNGLADFLCVLTGGGCIYKGRPMHAAHAGLYLKQAKFNAVAEDLQTAMEQSGVPYWTQNRLIALLAPMQRDIVTR